MVNIFQIFRKFDKHFYDYGFLKFAQKWNILKFVYGISFRCNKCKFTKKEDKIIKQFALY